MKDATGADTTRIHTTRIYDELQQCLEFYSSVWSFPVGNTAHISCLLHGVVANV